MDLQSVYYQVNDIRMHAMQAGPEDGPLVVLLHGFPEFWYGWRHQIEPLARAGFCVAAPDQRGYNLSDKPRGLDAYQLDILARDILGLVSALGREKACIVGHDWGGLVAWWMGIYYPGRVEKLAILNAPHPHVTRQHLLTNPRQMFSSTYAAFFQIPGLPEATLRSSDWALLANVMERTAHPGAFSPEDLEKYRQAWWRDHAMTSMLNWYRANRTVIMGLRGEGIVRPLTLLIWGGEDIALRPELAQASIDRCEQGRLAFFEGSSHWIQHEEVGAVNRLLIELMG